MTFILTNDDGIDAPGLRALQQAVGGQGIVVAPLQHHSATAIMNWRKHIAGTAETRPLYDLPSAPEWDAQAAGTYNVVAEMVDAFLRDGKRPEAIRSEPRRVCRRLFGLGQAARGRVPLAAWYCASASAGGT
ncbi:5'/3'-nucleotidase SurE [Leptolyngbya sp. 7M]|uniref:5'/3'-nucleotidase SurE n=1 Tax=Leptolyngbya sp. 7M TaxID=2812896 RepID=UPI001B8BC693|nr:5'/3'-nucleotidase SurE [Leptolyngbya sp. 7M]QYO64899.1 hypothetical protein JVX88_36050 [Leptolyngbya sp. 7M]